MVDDTSDEGGEPVETDELREGIASRLADALGDQLVETHIRPGDDLWVRVTRDAWVEAGAVARDRLGCRYFCFLSAIDWLPSPYGRYQDAEVDKVLDPVQPAEPEPVEQGYAGGDTRFQVVARVTNVREHWGFTLKVDLPDDDLSLATWVPNFHGANWHERETYEMYGIEFVGHPHLRKLYLPTGFEGHPLRKDFPLLARVVKPWPGIVDVEELPPDPDADDDDAGEEAEA